MTVFQVGDETISADEMVKLCAVDNELFLHSFFPKTIRQESAPFHLEMDQIMEDPNVRYAHFRIFRGAGKTTRLRTYTAKRIAYGLSRTILYVGASEGHAARSLQWLRGQIDRNKPLTDTFGLRPGKKWQETEVEIINDVAEQTAWILGVGITGNIRGINFDDYRPDLIILDDILTDENSATLEQRRKIIDLVFGALKESLTPRSEEPNAKIVFPQTPMHPEDASANVEKDPEWITKSIPCWTKETLNLPLEQQKSAWEVRFPSVELRAAKRSAAANNRLSTWVRENECRLISSELSAFKSDWIQSIPQLPPPGSIYSVLAIDPVPPPSDRELAKGLSGKDFECILVAGRRGPDYFVQEYVTNRGHEPNWTLWKIFELAQRHRVAKIVVEAVAYQRVLKWMIEQEMRRRGIFYQVDALNDKRSKYTRIVSTLSGISSQGQLFCGSHMVEFIQQFSEYPTEPDDIIDCAAMAFSKLVNPALEKLDPAMLDQFEHKRISLRGHP